MVISMTGAESHESIQYTSLMKTESIFILLLIRFGMMFVHMD